MNGNVTTFIEVVLNQELGEPFRRDAMTAPNRVAGIDKADMRPQPLASLAQAGGSSSRRSSTAPVRPANPYADRSRAGASSRGTARRAHRSRRSPPLHG